MNNGLTQTACFDSVIERPRYFARQLMTPAEMTQAQDYFRDKLRRHNRLLHGWGIVCGALVRQATDENDDPVPFTIEVSSGYVLDGRGNEILLPQTITYRLNQQPVSGHSARNGQQVDPWCIDVPIDRPLEGIFYVAVCYDECPTRPVRAAPAGCGCDDTDCEYSRIRESFIIQVLWELPPSYQDLLPQPPSPWDGDAYFGCDRLANCLACPEEPCVVLAAVEADGNGVLKIDCYGYRRNVLSYADYYYLCQQTSRPVTSESDKLRLAGDRLRTLIDDEGMNELTGRMGGAIGGAVSLQMTSMRGIGSTTEVGQILKDALTIGEVAAMTPDEFELSTDQLLQNVPATKRRAFTNNRALLWTQAKEIAQLTKPYRL